SPAAGQLEPEPNQTRFERQDAPDPEARPYTAAEQTGRGRIDSLTVVLSGEMIDLIFEKAGLDRPLDLDEGTLLDALGRALS
ncbi:chromosome partitioning protein ParB, partial [Acidithiobacillus caldus]|nr:chromosome partitioning protein ParB [Acidithiobacillus caldus]